ncbi:DUF3179 domain-containing protein [Salinisphaera sp. PC39]|uniref:DUF3179 domain-containing protein n=1 Tax=Salinisphaera sp. PC39 TaxID=1304156 RepID=UPI0033419840
MPCRIVSILLVCLPAMAGPAIAAPPNGPPLVMTSSGDHYWQASLSGGPGKDGIPSIDDPNFVPAAQADEWLAAGSRIIGVYRNGEAKAYPQSILVWHEIVNDTVGGDRLSVTYCPLTGTALGFLRGTTEFGVSGRLVNSNLIMYDRDSESHWPQILASAVEGPRKGRSLHQVRVFWTTWDRWRTRYPDTKVLSKEQTGHLRSYRSDPYGGYNPRRGYYAEQSPRAFPVMHESERYPPKREIYGFRTGSVAVAVDRAALAKHSVLRHRGKQADFLVLHDPGLGTAWVYRGEPGELPADEALRDLTFTKGGPRNEALSGLVAAPGFEAMWFAWYAFYPDTVVLDGNAD